MHPNSTTRARGSTEGTKGPILYNECPRQMLKQFQYISVQLNLFTNQHQTKLQALSLSLKHCQPVPS
uniref:Uncharacterized protein n=1 Tax=Rhizophora mucronata TaxID=61149 RepID=A0A2P2PZL1_RHIMU